MKNIFFICLFLSISLAVSGKKAQVSISCLKTEMLVNPQNIDCPSPRLSWEILSDVRDVRTSLLPYPRIHFVGEIKPGRR